MSMQDYFRQSLGLSGTETYKKTIFEQMESLKADYIVAHYSGGNDEGGVDGVTLYRTVDGERVALAEPENFGWEHPLYRALDDLLSLDFGTWAGDFSANGAVMAEASSKRIWREGEVSSYSSDESAGEY